MVQTLKNIHLIHNSNTYDVCGDKKQDMQVCS